MLSQKIQQHSGPYSGTCNFKFCANSQPLAKQGTGNVIKINRKITKNNRTILVSNFQKGEYSSRSTIFPGRQPKRWECKPIILSIFSKKLNGIEKKIGSEGGVRS